jgi:dissimilatory sulfite reductase (desulfoviridin) alpha/beta subunit
MITLKINGKELQADVPGDMPLLWVLRDYLELTGAKFGCGIGVCGSCTVLADGSPVRSCITPAASLEGKDLIKNERILTCGNCSIVCGPSVEECQNRYSLLTEGGFVVPGPNDEVTVVESYEEAVKMREKYTPIWAQGLMTAN